MEKVTEWLADLDRLHIDGLPDRPGIDFRAEALAFVDCGEEWPGIDWDTAQTAQAYELRGLIVGWATAWGISPLDLLQLAKQQEAA